MLKPRGVYVVFVLTQQHLGQLLKFRGIGWPHILAHSWSSVETQKHRVSSRNKWLAMGLNNSLINAQLKHPWSVGDTQKHGHLEKF
jgi:hypothetical protein